MFNSSSCVTINNKYLLLTLCIWQIISESQLQVGSWVWVCSHIFILGSRLKVQLWSKTGTFSRQREEWATSSFCSDAAYATSAHVASNTIMTPNPTIGKGDKITLWWRGECHIYFIATIYWTLMCLLSLCTMIYFLYT